MADDTLNENVLPVMGNEPAASFSVIWNVDTTDGAVKKNVKVDPPFPVASVTEPPPEGPYVGTTKSVENPIVAPPADITLTVHERISLMRTIAVDILV